MAKSTTFTSILGVLLLSFGVSTVEAVKVTLEKEMVWSDDGDFVGFKNPHPAILGYTGFSVIADYPTYIAGEVAENHLDGLLRLAAEYETILAVRRDFDLIQINGFTFSSFGTPNGIPDDFRLSGYGGEFGLFLVQFKAPLTPLWHEQLRQAGVVLAYFPENTFLVRLDPINKSELERIDGVQHVSLFHPAFKIRRSLLDRANTLDLTMRLDGGQDLSALSSAISNLTGLPTNPVTYTNHYSSVRASVDRSSLAALAARPEVLWIEPTLIPSTSGERDAAISSGKHNGIRPIRETPDGHKSWLEGKGFCTPTGTSTWPACMPYWTRVGVIDSGLDTARCKYTSYDENTGICTSWETRSIHQDLNHNSHPPGACPSAGQGMAVFDDVQNCEGSAIVDQVFCSGAIQQNHCERPPHPSGFPGDYNFSDEAFSDDGHGSSVASIIVGYPLGRSPGDPQTPQSDLDQFYLGAGIAPSSQLVIAKQPGLAPDSTGGAVWMTHLLYGELVSRIHENVDGVRFFNNSWNVVEFDRFQNPVGYDNQGAVDYTLFSEMADMLVREAQLDGELNEVSLLFSAGNWEGPPNTQWTKSPGNAKNVISVGAARGWQGQNGRPHVDCLYAVGDLHEIDDIAGGIEPGNPNPIIWHSRRGYINEPGSSGSNPRYKPDLVAPGTMVAASRSEEANTSDVYRCFSGTSAATPNVTGAAVLAEAYYFYRISGETALPSPAMIKGMLVAHADDLVGGDDEWPDTVLPHSPSIAQGWGRVNLDRLIQVPPAGEDVDGIIAFDQDHDPTVGTIWTPSGEGRRFIFTGQYWSINLEVSDTQEDVIIAMTYTDAPADPASSSSLTVNDLDLSAFKFGVSPGAGHQYWGNHFDNNSWYSKNTVGQILIETPFDSHNNVEVIRIPAGTMSGTFWVKIVARTINEKSVPGLDQHHSNQDFALYIVNANTN